MADQLCGLWYLRMMDWPEDKIPFSVPNCRGALQTVFDNNVMRFGGGRMGAVNGFRVDRDAKDVCCIQSQEVWTGTVYGLAAHMMVEGMAEQGRDHSFSFADTGIISSQVLFLKPVQVVKQNCVLN